MNKIQPMGDRVLVRIADEGDRKSEGGIVLPGNANRDYTRGRVVAVGPGDWHHGEIRPVRVNVGQEVIIDGYGYRTIKQNGEAYILIAEQDIVAVLWE